MLNANEVPDAQFDSRNVIIPATDLSRCPVEDVLKKAKVTSRHVLETSSTEIRVYDTTGILISPQEWPYYITAERDMLSLMMDDLYLRVLPIHPTTQPQSIQDAKLAMRFYEISCALSPISHKASLVDSTHTILRACVALAGAVGVFSTFFSKEKDKVANVTADSGILVYGGGGVVVGDETPQVYASKCNDQEVERVCDSLLLLKQNETNFRAIILKLSQYMIRNKIQWGCIHGGVHLRVVRVEYKNKRPFIIVSGNIPVDSPAPNSMYSLICYMLLTAHEDKVRILGNVRDRIPDPPSLTEMGAGRRNLMGPRVSARSAFSDEIQVPAIVLHTTAGGGSIPVDIVLRRKTSSQGQGAKLDLEVTRFLGAGRFGRVFQCDAFFDDVFLGVLVVKLALSKDGPLFDVEEKAYTTLRSLYDTVIPRFYGHFYGESNGNNYSALLLGYGGESLKSLEDLSLPERYDLFTSVRKFHHCGVTHGDIHFGNVLRSEQGIRVIDFSLAQLSHECRGLNECGELRRTAELLNLNHGGTSQYFEIES